MQSEASFGTTFVEVGTFKSIAKIAVKAFGFAALDLMVLEVTEHDDFGAGGTFHIERFIDPDESWRGHSFDPLCASFRAGTA